MSWFAPAPARRLALLRIAVGSVALVYLVARSPHLIGFGDFADERFDPVGIVAMLTDAPLPAQAVTALVLAAIAAGIAFVAGWQHRVAGPLFGLLLLWVTSFRNSWGLVLHTENLMAMHVLVLGLVSSADACSLDARRRRLDPGAADERYGWPIRLLVLVTVLAYFVAGWAKVRNGGWEWVNGDVLRNQIANDNLRKLLAGDFYSPLGGWLTRYGWMFPPMAWASMIVELGAPLALLGRRLGKLWAAAAWGFHLAILALMMIVFPYQLLFVAFLPFFPVEEWWDRARAVVRRRTGTSAVPIPS